ncbi:hypothetical protein SAMN05216351_105114 [Pseudobutyrivibrio sp. JW11]|uniref:hypothetical protein n=1 Tax=Pseudobutyrivibrio sp. JW11 TaxID=1855302 RepID=UPI0008E8F177|nr:hypothetical protein [Pseudobutyrivibrio sp. JW11]SFO26767.1 hypothetical protein SAMN05216351_105114 [Pseudobutyrivibrio sp. JW11]
MKKKIIAIVVVICLLVTGFFGYQFYKNKKAGEESANNETEQSKPEEIEEISFVPVSEEDALSQAQWMKMLNEAFQFTDYTEYNSDKINGSFAVATGFEKLGGACLDFYLEGKENTLENKCSVAVDLGLIDENYIDSYIGQEQATALIENLKALLEAGDYHVEKNEVEFAENVVDGQEWTAEYFSQVEEDGVLKSEVIIDTNGYEPQIDEKIVYLDQNGIMHGGKVVAVEARDGGQYDIMTEPVNSQADLIEDYTIAGYVDWSKVQDMTGNTAFANPQASACATKNNASHSVDIVIKGTVSNEGWELSEFSVDGVVLSGDDEEDSEEEDEEESEEEESDEESDEDNESEETHDDSEGESDEEDEDEDEGVSAEGSASGDVEIVLKGVQIYAYVKDDKDVSFDVSFTPYVKLENITADLEVALPALPLGVGVLSCEVSPSILLDEDLGLTVEFEPQNPVCLSTNNNESGGAASINENTSDFDIGNVNYLEDVSLDLDEFHVAAGAQLGLSVKLCEFINVAEPSFTSRMVLVGRALDVVEGYEYPCFEVKAAGPICSVALASDGTLLDYFLDRASLPGEIQLNGINDDNALLFAKYYHIEVLPIKLLEDPNGNASVCTHYRPDEDHESDEKIAFDYAEVEESADYDTDAAYFVEINGERFGFEFENDEYEEQYLAYLDNLSKEDIMGYGMTSADSAAFNETDYIFNNSEWFSLSYEDREKVNMFMPGDFVVVNGCDISDIRIPRIMSSFLGASFLNSGYVYGDVVGQITYDDESRFEDTIIDLGSSSFSYRRPYRNMENTE